MYVREPEKINLGSGLLLEQMIMLHDYAKNLTIKLHEAVIGKAISLVKKLSNEFFDINNIEDIQNNYKEFIVACFYIIEMLSNDGSDYFFEDFIDDAKCRSYKVGNFVCDICVKTKLNL